MILVEPSRYPRTVLKDKVGSGYQKIIPAHRVRPVTLKPEIWMLHGYWNRTSGSAIPGAKIVL